MMEIPSKKQKNPGVVELEEGSKLLVEDLKVLLAEAEAGEFGDFTNEKYVAPKIALAEKLAELRDNVINGKYD